MQLFNFVSVKLSLCLMAGIAIGFYTKVAPQYPLLGLLVLLPFLYTAYKRQSYPGFPYFALSAFSATVLLGMFAVGMACSKRLGHHYVHKDLTTAHLWQLKVDEVLKPNPYAWRYVAKVISVDQQERSGKILLSLLPDTTSTPLKADDVVVMFSKAEEISPPSYPHQFDYKAYLSKQGLYHQIRTHSQAVHRVAVSPQTFKGMAANYRERLIAQLRHEGFGQEELAVIQALLLGKRDDISEHTYTAYKDAGALHILAVSGLHVGILLLLLHWGLSPLERLPRGKTLKLILMVGLLWAYAFVAGLSPSVVRAVTMFSFVAYAMSLNRPTNAFNVVAVSMFFVLLIHPLFLFQVGFQMSYAAVFAIIWIYPKLQRFWKPRNFILQKAWQLLSVSLAAQLGVLPVSLFYFHQFPALFFVANLLVVPFLGLILGVGVAVIVWSQLGGLPAFLAAGYNTVIKTMNAVIGWVAQHEGFVLRDIPFDGVQLLLGYLLVLVLVVFLSQPKWKHTVALLVSIMALQGWMLGKQWQLGRKEALFLAHTSQNTVLGHQTGSHLTLYTRDSTKLHRMVQSLTVGESLQSVSYNPLQKSYCLGDQRLYIMEGLGWYPPQGKIDLLLLTQSPKINLERLLDTLRPKKVLADGSNYRSAVAQWKKTCAAQAVPFYSTGESGAFYFEIEEER